MPSTIVVVGNIANNNNKKEQRKEGYLGQYVNVLQQRPYMWWDDLYRVIGLDWNLKETRSAYVQNLLP